MQLNFEQLFIENIFQILLNQPKKSVLLQPQKKVGRSPIALSILNLEYQIIKIINKQNNNTKMKREFTKLMAALALLTFLAVPLGMWGQTVVTFTPGTDTGATSVTKGDITATMTTMNNASYYQIYANQSGTFTTTNGVITKIEFTCTASGTSKYGPGNASSTVGNYSYSENVGTWTGSETSVTISSTAQVRMSLLKITYTPAGGGDTPTTYTVTFDVGDGTFVASEDFLNASNTVVAGTYTLPSATPAAGYTFDGWAIGEDTYQGGASYTVSGDAAFTASYTQNGGSSTETAKLTVNSFPGLTSSYTSGTVTVDEIVYSYENFIKNSSSIQVKASSGLLMNNTAYPGDITSVVITHSGTANPTTIYGSADGTNWTQVATGSGSINANFSNYSNYHFKYFKITRGTGAAYWTKVEITYSTIATYSVTYDANGATSGTVPTDATVYDDENNTVTVLGNTGNLAKTGCTWAGWNTQADGNGTNYTTGNTFTISANTTLYAKWNTKTITNLSYTGTPATTTYYAGQSFDPTGLTVTATFNDNSSENVTSSVVWTPDPLTQGTTSVTGTYMGQTITVNGLTVTATPGTENNPYTVAQAIAATPSSGSTANVYIHGFVCAFYGSNDDILDENAHRYYISDDGNTTTKLLVYKGKGLNNVDFSNVNDLLIGDEITVLGQLKMYSNAPEVDENNYIVSLVRPSDYTLTNAMTNVAEYFVFVGDDEIEFDNNNQAQVRAGATVYVSLTMEDCYALTSLTVNGSTTGVTEEEPGVYYSFVMPEGDATIGTMTTQATQYTLTVVGEENVSFDLLAGFESTPVSLTNGTASICEQSFVTIADLTANSGLFLQSVTLTVGGSTTTLTLEDGVYHFNMPSSNATLTFTTATAPTYTLATSIVSGKSYIIVGFDDDAAYAMGEQKNSNRAGVGITVDGNTATGNASVHEVVITAIGNDMYSIEDGGYLYASSSSSNQLKTESDLDANGKWTIGIANNGDATITAQGSNSRKLMRFNPNTSNNNPLFACYATNSTTGSSPRLYVKNETHELSIDGYTDVTEGTNNKGYYLIASPVTVDPSTIAGMTEGDFDLYYFDQAQEDEWRNYEATPFNLVPGTGYLYAKKATAENQTYSFELTGTPYAGNGTIDLDYDANAEFPGFNLIGNPFGTNATLDQPYYRLNSDGSALNTLTESSQVLVMEGVFVEATSTIRTATFSPAAKRVSQLNVKVTRNRSAVLDNAIIRFDNGAVLGKFQLNPNSTKLYITEGNQDFAVVRSNNEGEMPVSFKAEKSGIYTFNVEAENVEMSYLHLIDNLTGADVDLLATPSYSFEANTRDYANRFKLVFKANTGVEENTATETFAYFNGSEWVINNPSTGSGDNATLQVIDMMGRVLSSETLNGNANVNINQAAGIYMLRLVNGENVKIQKVVVR